MMHTLTDLIVSFECIVFMIKTTHLLQFLSPKLKTLQKPKPIYIATSRGKNSKQSSTYIFVHTNIKLRIFFRMQGSCPVTQNK